MKRLALHLLLCLLTFSAGVGIEKILIPKTQPPTEATPVNPIMFEPLPSANTFLATPVSTPLPTPLPTPSPSSNLILDYDVTRFDPYGEYTVIGTRPQRITEFAGFFLELYEGEDVTAAGDIFLWTTGKESTIDQHRVFGLVTEKRLILATAPTDEGTVYRFDGEFLRGKVISNAPEGQAVLKGTLTKSKNGRKIAESPIKLKVEVHGC